MIRFVFIINILEIVKKIIKNFKIELLLKKGIMVKSELIGKCG